MDYRWKRNYPSIYWQEFFAIKARVSSTVALLKAQVVELTQTNTSLKSVYAEKIAQLQEENFIKILEVVKASK